MSESAAQTMYRTEWIKGFEKRESLLRRTVTTEVDINGAEAVFLVADSGSAEAVTRGNNGKIPTRAENLQQYTATLKEWHDIPERTKFNIYTSQGDGAAMMQSSSSAVINRKIDKDIYGALSAGTVSWNSGSAGIATMASVGKALTILSNSFASEDGNDVFAAITPAYYTYLMGLDQFTSVDFIQGERFEGYNKSKAFNWYGINWIVDAGITGAGTADAKCYMYNKAAIGHACNVAGMDAEIGYDKKQDSSWARVSSYMGSKLLQDSGIVVMEHDDTQFSA